MIRATGLTKDFVGRKSTVHAVRGIDLNVDRGETVAVLGPNGAGKTTTMRMLTTLLAPTAGTAQVGGFDVTEHPGQVRRLLGYVGQGNGAAHQQRALDELYSQGVTFGLSGREARARGQELMAGLDLAGKEKTKVTELSGGQRRRLDVAMGLMHAPELLVLDEPSTGLDPHNRANLWDHIRELRAAHDITLLLTTHYLDEADAMAQRVVIIDHGEVIADDTPEALKKQYAGDQVSLTVADQASAVTVAGLLGAWPGSEVSVDGCTVRASVEAGSARIAELVREADRAAVDITDIQSRRPTLDDVFLNLTGRSLRDDHRDPSTGAGGETAPSTTPSATSEDAA